MNTAFIYISIIFIVYRQGTRAANYEEFHPRTIPINEWDSNESEEKVGGAGSLQETISLGSPKIVAVVPPHYWEDALRHSVYLTLVRDKIDQLISQGLAVAPDSKPDIYPTKDVDDHNLWDKIKTAPFDRLSPDEPPMVYGDLTILAKGRLLKENNGFRFTQDKMTKEKCNEQSCMEGIKAYWSVKRVRQRDSEKNPTKYHYELTFSVLSHNYKKQMKPYENPVRTFTLRESNAAMEPKPHVTEPTKYVSKPQKALWFHANLNAQSNYHSRKTYQPPILDRLFLSIFSEEDPEVHSYSRYKPIHQPPIVQSAKLGHGESVEHQKKVGYRYSKPHNTRFSNRVPPPLTINFPPTPPLAQPPSQYEVTEKYTDKYTISGSLVKQPTGSKLLNEFDNKYGQLPDKDFNEYVNLHNQPSEQKQTTEIVSKYTQKPNQTFTTTEAADKFIPQPDQKQYSQFDNIHSFRSKPSNLRHKFTRQSEHKHISESDKIYTYPTDHRHHKDFDTYKYTQPDLKLFTTNVVKSPKSKMPLTPPLQYPYLNLTMSTNNKPNATEPTTKEQEIITYNVKTKPKNHITKFGHFSDHVRPPVFNAPPGIFLTMDKKPFKPMPPLKLPFLSKQKAKKLNDFRPSPQVHEVQFSDPDFHSDSFRPITINYADSNTTEFRDLAAPVRNHTKTKPKHKHEHIKSHRTTTTTTTQAPEIITAQSNFSIEKMTLESMNWANSILGTYSVTTPMLSTIIEEITETTPVPSTTTSTTDTSWLLETLARPVQTTSTTTETPKKKRTRPPTKFGSAKAPRSKKHKRVTTSAPGNITSTTTTTVKPLSRRTIPDLSSQTTKKIELTEGWEQNNTITSTSPSSKTPTKVTTTTTTSTTTTTTTTTPRPMTTSTITTTPTTTTTESTTTQYKRNNRFRVSTLMYKGTSVKHDKWNSVTNSNIDKSKTVKSIVKPTRRKASNFHGYVSSTPKTVEEERIKEDHYDKIPDSYYPDITVKPISERTKTVQSLPNTDDLQPQYIEIREQEAVYDNDVLQDFKDPNEYVLSVPNSNFNDDGLSDPGLITFTEIPVTTSVPPSTTNKTKCKKNITNTTTTPTLHSTSTTKEALSKLETVVLSNNNTDTPAVSDIFDEIFGFTADPDTDTYHTNSSEPIGAGSNNEKYYSTPGGLEDFLKSLTSSTVEVKTEHDQDYDDKVIGIGPTMSDEDEEDEDYVSREDESERSRHPDEPAGHSFSFIELLNMD